MAGAKGARSLSGSAASTAEKARFLEEGRLRGVVDHIVGVLAADRGAEVQHHGFGHDQPAAQIQVAPHPLGIDAAGRA